MKTRNLFSKSITHLLAFLILFQGCTVYKKQNISLEQAMETKDKVKLVTHENKKQKYLYVTKINEDYYGIKKGDGKTTKFLLQEDNFKIIRTENKIASTFTSLLTLLVVVFAALVIGSAQDGYI